MGLIPKIVSTPIKWVCKRVLHATLLRFPGGKADTPLACTYCPELCRFACPVAVATGDDTVTPCNKMSLLYKEAKWPRKMPPADRLWPLFQCSGCGRCSEYCLYRVTVPDQLFAARSSHRWAKAAEVASRLDDDSDPCGDLADELGDRANALRRLEKFRKTGAGCTEPKAVHFAGAETLKWEALLAGSPSEDLKTRLAGKTWLVHESVWLSRRLERADVIERWTERARAGGVKLELPFAHGRDCADCGGEGAYRQVYPVDAKKMATELWKRDCHRANGILCFSRRCADHFRASLGPEVPVIWVAEGFQEESK